tara:strand:- start:7112 stop:7303 length:192 start_codon:yes stop_codon:yes gene_type:complete
MGFKRKMVNMFFRSKRAVRSFVRNKTTKRVVSGVYNVYQVVRVVRNPFVLLEYVNVYNVLRLL